MNYGTGQGAQEKALVTGRVISNRMERTIVVAKNNRVWDARLHFAVPRAKKYYAHDPMDACEVGDIVQIRPLGKARPNVQRGPCSCGRSCSRVEVGIALVVFSLQRRRGSKTVTFELVNIVRRDPGMRFAESIARVLPYVRAAKGQDPALMREITPGR